MAASSERAARPGGVRVPSDRGADTIVYLLLALEAVPGCVEALEEAVARATGADVPKERRPSIEAELLAVLRKMRGGAAAAGAGAEEQAGSGGAAVGDEAVAAAADERIELRDLYASFGWGEQDQFRAMDAQELLNTLLDAVPALQGHFSGRFANTLYCVDGKHEGSRRTEEFFTLNVPRADTLPGALAKFAESERIDDYQCDTCNARVAVDKASHVSAAPRCLIIGQTRFDFDFMTMRRVKVTTPCPCPDPLLVSTRPTTPAAAVAAGQDADDDEAEVTYECIAAVHHTGLADGGAFTTVTRSSSDGQWRWYTGPRDPLEATQADTNGIFPTEGAGAATPVLQFFVRRDGRTVKGAAKTG